MGADMGASGEGSGACLPAATTLVIPGGDARWSHACGEPCAPDWCWCDPCLVLDGSLGSLAEGPHTLEMLVAASGDAQLRVVVADADGPLVDESFTLPDADDRVAFDFDVAPGCGDITLELHQDNLICSRVYTIWVDP